jgi:hypothetical protein
MNFEIGKIYRFKFSDENEFILQVTPLLSLGTILTGPYISKDHVTQGFILATNPYSIFGQRWTLVTNKYKEAEEITLKDLPLYIGWNVTNKFTELLSAIKY